MTAEQQLFDLSLLEQMSDKNFVIQVIDIYLQDSKTDMTEMKNAFTTGDLETVYKKAHKVKSSTGMLKADNLFNLLGRIEQIAKTGTNDRQLTESVEHAVCEFNRLQSALQLHLQDIQQVA